MATGIELLVAAALCLACPPVNETMPEGLILLNPDGSLVTEMPIDLELEDAGLIEEAPVETLEVLRNKKEKLRNMKEWINGKHLKIATLEDYPLSYTELLDNGTRIGRGVSFQIIEFLQKKFNFTFDVVVPQDNIIGSTTDLDRSLIEMVNNTVSESLGNLKRNFHVHSMIGCGSGCGFYTIAVGAAKLCVLLDDHVG